MLKRKGHLGAGAVSEGLAIFIKIEGYFFVPKPGSSHSYCVKFRKGDFKNK